jgi:SAM-dependent methyltransferase
MLALGQTPALPNVQRMGAWTHPPCCCSLPPMALDGARFYDEREVFETYQQHRARPESPNRAMEEPVLLDLLGPTVGLRVLDLGCGSAGLGRRLLDGGCRRYVGIEGSANMANDAQRTLVGTSGVVLHQRIEHTAFPTGSFDLVVSRMALHYVEDLGTVLSAAHGWLSPGGRLVFSVEHPVVTSCDAGWHGKGPRGSWVVDGYFDTGWRETDWMGGRVRKYHRPVEDYVRLVQAAEFRLDTLREARPLREHFTSEEEYRRRCRIPLMLLLAGTAA